ncbi:hypothetical protein BDD12DRAFT_326377 [Trichophaea hybrida]|nr:hypothetical protein BDD12DRAFT_326377 [Trichophaea hybrida]
MDLSFRLIPRRDGRLLGWFPGWDGPLRRILGGNGRLLGWFPGWDGPLSVRCIPAWESTFLTSSNVIHFCRFPDQERVLSHFIYEKVTSFNVRRQARLRLCGDDSHWSTNRYELVGPRVGSRPPWMGINRYGTPYADANGTSQGAAISLRTSSWSNHIQ